MHHTFAAGILKTRASVTLMENVGAAHKYFCAVQQPVDSAWTSTALGAKILFDVLKKKIIFATFLHICFFILMCRLLSRVCYPSLQRASPLNS